MDHYEDLALNIEEEAPPSNKELESLMAWTENHVCNNNNMTDQVVNDNINSNITAGDPGSFILISGEDMDKSRVEELQDKLKKQAPTTIASSLSEIPGFPDGPYWEELLPQSSPVEEPTNTFQACAPTVPEEDHFHVPQKLNFDLTMEKKAFAGKVKTKVIKCYIWKRLQKV
eukprot:9547531-Ditylum_brightwellii.AAC.1